MPRAIVALGFVSLFTDMGSEIVHSLLPVLLAGTLGASALVIGLIEGAADGAGIGDRFLGHIERCRVLIHLIDINGTDPAEALEIIEEELAAYGGGLDEKPRLIALNKIDTVDRELVNMFIKDLKAAGANKSYPISGATGKGMDALMDAVLAYLPSATVTERPTGQIEDAQIFVIAPPAVQAYVASRTSRSPAPSAGGTKSVSASAVPVSIRAGSV